MYIHDAILIGTLCVTIILNNFHSALSEVPTSKAVAGVRVGLVGDKYIVNPTSEEMENSELDLMLAGTDSAILMIEVITTLACGQYHVRDMIIEPKLAIIGFCNSKANHAHISVYALV